MSEPTPEQRENDRRFIKRLSDIAAAEARVVEAADEWERCSTLATLSALSLACSELQEAVREWRALRAKVGP